MKKICLVIFLMSFVGYLCAEDNATIVTNTTVETTNQIVITPVVKQSEFVPTLEMLQSHKKVLEEYAKTIIQKDSKTNSVVSTESTLAPKEEVEIKKINKKLNELNEQIDRLTKEDNNETSNTK